MRMGRWRRRSFLYPNLSLDFMLSSEQPFYSMSPWSSAPACSTSNSNVHNCINHLPLSSITPVHTWKSSLTPFICVYLPPHFPGMSHKILQMEFPNHFPITKVMKCWDAECWELQGQMEGTGSLDYCVRGCLPVRQPVFNFMWIKNSSLICCATKIWITIFYGN